MGEQLVSIAKVFEGELTLDGSGAERAAYDETVVLQALAQLKQVRDVLLNRLSEDDCFWLYSVKQHADSMDSGALE